MSLSTKIDVENRIFARAYQLEAPIYTKYGRLSSPADDLELQTLLHVYNVHFGLKNAVPQEGLQARKEYLAQCTYPVGKVCCYSAQQDMNFELSLSESK